MGLSMSAVIRTTGSNVKGNKASTDSDDLFDGP